MAEPTPASLAIASLAIAARATPGTRPDPEEAVRTVSQRLRFTDAQAHDVLAHFIRGDDVTGDGVMHAVTRAAQTLDDADTAHEMESLALRALELGATA